MQRAVRLAFVAVIVAGLGACSSSSGRSGSPSPSSVPPTGGTSTAGGIPTTPETNTSGAHWTTYDGDTARTGLASDGPARAGSVRKLWTTPALDGDVYAQPLLIGNEVIVATENNTVYALRAADGSIVWKRHLGEPVPASSLPCGNVDPVGITSTPVVDVRGGRVYVVALVQPTHHVLFALTLATGRVASSVRVDVEGADAAVHNQRGALTLSNGTVLVPYGGRYGDCGDYHGRVVAVAVSARAFAQPKSYTLPTQREGGFWAPPGPVLDSNGNLFLASGNSSSSGAYDYGNSVVRLTPTLGLADSWAPKDWATLNAGDVDIGSSSPVLLSGNRVFQIGKAGVGYLLAADHLGGVGGELHSGDVCGGAGVFGGSAHDGNIVFVPCSGGVVQVTVNGDTFATGWTARMSTPGPTIVANGAVWTVATDDGELVALDESSGRPLTSQHLGPVPSRFTSPAAGGGRVIVAAGRVVIAFGS
jgi:outer membrane protein assembly factor BamB